MISASVRRFTAIACLSAGLFSDLSPAMTSSEAQPSLSPAVLFAQVSAPTVGTAADKSAQIDRGRQFYLKNCFVCHQLNGQGTLGAFPPLAQSDFLAADKERAIRILCEGVSGEITVNGKKFDSIMP